MLFPVYVTTASDSGVTGRSPLVPDFTFRGATISALLADIREILATIAAPMPDNVAQLMASAADYGYEGGDWICVPLGVSSEPNPSVRFNASFPARLLKDIDVKADDLGLTRSGFLAAAAREKLGRPH